MRRNGLSPILLVAGLAGCQIVSVVEPTSLTIPSSTSQPPSVAPSSTPQPSPSVTPNIPFKLTEWAELHAGIRLILYLDDPSRANAARVLRAGLLEELARSGELSPGYPKQITAPFDKPWLCNQELVASGSTIIHFSADPSDHVEIPFCPRQSQDYYLRIYILQVDSSAESIYKAPLIYIGFGRDWEPYSSAASTRLQLVLQALTNMDLVAYQGEDVP